MKDISYIEEKRKRIRRVNEYLKKLIEEGEIKDYFYDDFDYWEGILYIKLNNDDNVVLAKSFFNGQNQSCLVSIYDCKNFGYAKRKIQNAIKTGKFE